MWIEYNYKITNTEYFPEGYFFHLANSRSGHNFIRKNIQSWINDPDENIRKYINFENQDVEKLHNTLSDDKSLGRYPNSIYVLSIRNLLNWYPSFFYFHMKYLGKYNKTVEYFRNKVIVYKSEFDKNPKLTYNNPNLIVLDDGASKEDFIKKQTRINDKIVNIPLNFDRWLVIAKEFIGETNYLPQFVKIYYDDFFQSKEYRTAICGQIGGTYNENKLDYVTRAGGFSSFDGDSYQGRGREMNVLQRWKQWKPEHFKYLKLLKEHPALEFYLKNFDVSIEEKQFIDSI